MALQRFPQRAFGGGELAPVLAARADLARYAIGLRTCRNFFVRRSGGVSNRAGLRYIATTKTGGSNLITLHRWVFTAANASTLIEAGDKYFRFYQNGVQLTVSAVAAYNNATAYDIGDLVLSGGINYYCIAATTGNVPPNATYWYALTGSIYEIPTPYDAGAFNSPGPLRFAQNGAESTVTHPGYQPYVLANLTGALPNPKWTLTALATAPTVGPPTALGATPGAAGTLNPQYVVTAIDATTGEESLPTAPATCAAALAPTEAAPNVLTWTAPVGFTISEYRVYKDPAGNGTFGYLGTATGQVTFMDDGVALPDLLQTPQQARVLFASTDDYPDVCTSYQQRRVFANTANQPWTFFASRIGFRNNFCVRSPLQDDDAVTATMEADELNIIRHLIRLKRLVVMTNGGEWIVRGDETGTLVPSAINLDQFGYAGAARAFPAVVGQTIIYVQARGNIVRDLSFDQQVESGLTGRDLTVLASHLFEGFTISRLEFQQAPDSIVWAVRSDGTLLGLTYLPGDDLWGWHRHDTSGGVIEDICVVPEGDQDVLYAVVRRVINGNTVRYIEQLERRLMTLTDATLADEAFFVDAGITYDGVSTTAITGLDHLEGEDVMALADGLVQGPFTVSGGAITLTTAAAVVHVGLPITAQLETLDLDNPQSDVRTHVKRVPRVGLLIDCTAAGFTVGPTSSDLQPVPVPVGLSGLMSDVVDTTVLARYDTRGRVFLQQTDPLPLSVLGIVPMSEIGG